MGNERRNFIKTGLLGASFLTIIPRGLRAQSEDCEVITRDFFGLGPFYSAGAPTRHVLAAPEEEGTRLFLEGHVYARDCVTPLGDVVLDIWHADDSGCYSRFEDCENPSGDDFKLRGVIRTGASGTFALETVKPGHYLNGAQFRPSHIHLIVRPPGAAEVVTQLYFEGDPYIDIDAAASRPDAAGRIIPLESREDGEHGIFDIILDIDPPSSVEESASVETFQLRQNHPNPVETFTRIPFELAEPAPVEIAIYDLAGVRVITLLQQRQMNAGRHAVEWDRKDGKGNLLPAGTYICRLKTDEGEGTRLMTLA